MFFFWIDEPAVLLRDWGTGFPCDPDPAGEDERGDEEQQDDA